MVLPDLCLIQKSSPDADNPVHLPAPNTSPLVLPQVKVPVLFGDKTLFLKGPTSCPGLLYPGSYLPTASTHFLSFLGTCTMSQYKAKVASLISPIAEMISTQQIFHVLPYISKVPLQAECGHSSCSGQNEQKLSFISLLG